MALPGAGKSTSYFRKICNLNKLRFHCLKRGKSWKKKRGGDKLFYLLKRRTEEEKEKC